MSRLIRLGCGIYSLVHLSIALGVLAYCIFIGLVDRFIAVTAVQLLLASAGWRAATVSPQKTFSDRLLAICVGIGLIYDVLYLLNGGAAPAMSIPVLGPVSVLIEFDAAYRLVHGYTAGVAILPLVFVVTSAPVLARLLSPSRDVGPERTGYL
jgi:hypothetical protein